MVPSVIAPPSANPAAATVDLFYEVANDDRALRLGQKVGVTIGVREAEESLVALPPRFERLVVEDFGGDERRRASHLSRQDMRICKLSP